ncbi:MAG: primosomal protein N', partial [Dethiobacteria bacterium]
MGYAEVVIDLMSDAVDKPFHYRIPPALEQEVKPGRRVLVPFGSRQLTGFVLRLLEKPEIKQTKDITDVLDEQPLLNEEFRELAIWLSKRYYCRLIDAIHCLIPAGLNRIKGKKIFYVYPAIDIDANLIEKLSSKTPKQSKVLEFFFKKTACVPLAELLRITGVTASPVRSLAAKGYLKLVKEKCPPEIIKRKKEQVRKARLLVLNNYQEQALNEIRKAIDSREQKTFLLHGVTGSGKTEVYLRAVEAALEKGLGALILVPEISLTPQMVNHFSARFGGGLAVLHSRLSEGERHRQWWRVKKGDAKVVLGARSAVFAPLVNPGLFILDEEHENNYKQDENPRYHAREVALWRAQFHQAVLLLGTATPSLESYTKVKEQEYVLLRLPQRIGGKKIPPVEIIDMRKELKAGNKTIFSRALYRELKETIARGEQAILFLNRRGYSNFILCRNCGYVLRCSSCSVSLTYHYDLESLLCHYCSRMQAIPKSCPKCSSRYIRNFGIGTQKVEQIFKQFFPGIKSIRMDTDSTTRKGAHEKLLQSFCRGEASVLIGTQMIAKGLDLPRVTLVGVISADASLHLPDFRAGERTFQLLEQVSGRAGRGSLGGKVIVQTYHPDHYSIKAASTHDYNLFYQEELRRRLALDYPPFTDILRFLFISKYELEAAKAAERLKPKLSGIMGQDDELLGPGPAPIAKLKDTYRYQMLFKGKRLFEREKVIRNIVNEQKVELR